MFTFLFFFKIALTSNSGKHFNMDMHTFWLHEECLSMKCLDYLVYFQMLFPNLLVIQHKLNIFASLVFALWNDIKYNRRYRVFDYFSYLIENPACVLIYVIMVCHTKPWSQSPLHSQLQKNENLFQKTWNIKTVDSEKSV